MMWPAPPAPIQSRMSPCSGQSRPSPAGGREDAASLDRPCARRLCDLAVGTEECSRRGSNQRMDPTEQENDFNKDRKSLLCPDASPYSARFLTAVHKPRAKTRRNAIGHSAGPKRGRQHEQQSGHSADALNLAKNPQSERAVSWRPTWVLLTLCPDSAI